MDAVRPFSHICRLPVSLRTSRTAASRLGTRAASASGATAHTAPSSPSSSSSPSCSSSSSASSPPGPVYPPSTARLRRSRTASPAATPAGTSRRRGAFPWTRSSMSTRASTATRCVLASRFACRRGRPEPAADCFFRAPQRVLAVSYHPLHYCTILRTMLSLISDGLLILLRLVLCYPGPFGVSFYLSPLLRFANKTSQRSSSWVSRHMRKVQLLESHVAAYHLQQMGRPKILETSIHRASMQDNTAKYNIAREP